MSVAQTFTARAAVAVARAEYIAMMHRAFAESDDRVQRVAERAFHRGHAALQALEATATDVSLSAHAEDALQGYLAALRSANEDAAFAWLDLFPEMVRDVRRDADVRVQIRRVTRQLPVATGAAEPASADGRSFHRAANKRPALALAA
jgi:hypothetical protein